MKVFKRPSLLSSAPSRPPQYAVRIPSRQYGELLLADPRVNRLALALMDMQAQLGGAASHWGGPSAFAEIAAALYALVFAKSKQAARPWHSMFHIINDAGHCENGLYALRANYRWGIGFEDLKGFRSLNSFLTGHGEAHVFPQGVYLSNGPLGSTLAQAEGLCMADRLQGLKRTSIVLSSDGALMEGEAKEALCSIPGLAAQKKLNPFLLIVSDNNTKLSGRIDQDSFSLDPVLKSLSALGWKLISLTKAHNLKSCVGVIETALDSLKNHQPVCIRAKTIKGYGAEQTQTSEHGGHGFPLKTPEKLLSFLNEIYGEKLPPYFVKWAEELKKTFALSLKKNRTKKQANRVKVQAGLSRALLLAGEKGLPIVSISADLQGSTGVLAFRKKHPAFAFDVGVAEANMISTAAGFAKQGFIPVVDTFTQFGVTKGALPLFMAGLSQAPMIALFSHAGLQDAADGASHQNLSYLSQTASLPLTNVYVLTSAEEAFNLLSQAIESFVSAYQAQKVPKTHIFFFGREVFPPSFLAKGHRYQLNKAQVVFPLQSLKNKGRGEGVVLMAAGPMLEPALEAAQILQDKGWKVFVINPSIINHPDVNLIIKCLRAASFRLLTIEDHYLTGGMGALIAHRLLEKDIVFKMRSMAVQSAFGRSAYQSAELYKKEGLTPGRIAAAVLAAWGS